MFEDIISSASERYQVPEPWIQAVISVESAWNPSAYRAEPKINDASYGLMQLLTRTAHDLGFVGSATDLYDPAVNIDLGTKLLGQLRASYGDNFQRVYSAYNSGNPDRWQTSTQVAQHVARAMSALETYASEAVESLVSAADDNPGSFITVGIVVLALMYAWGGRRKS